MRVSSPAWLGTGLLFAVGGAALAQVRDQPLDHQSVVYIECEDPKDSSKRSSGTGVVVSKEGHVLTAAHVVPDGYKCRGAKGSLSKVPVHYMYQRHRSRDHDVLMLEFVQDPSEQYKPVVYAKLDDSMQGFDVSAYGFPKNHLGPPVRRTGTIGTTQPDAEGFIDTDAPTNRGMSGGPVVLDTGELIGIVAGSDYDPATGEVTRYAVLAADEFAGNFPDLQRSALPTVTETTNSEGSGAEVSNPIVPANLQRLVEEAIADQLASLQPSANPAAADTKPSKSNEGSGAGATPVSDPTAYPARAVAKVLFSQGQISFTCSGTLVSDDFVLTARHCLFDEAAEDVVDISSIQVIPAYAQGRAPFGICGATKSFVWPSRGESEGTAGLASGSPVDGIGGLQLDCSIGARTGYLGLASFPFTDGTGPIRLFGYDPEALVTSEVEVVASDENTITYTGLNQRLPGASGGPLLVKHGNEELAIGLHAAQMTITDVPGAKGFGASFPPDRIRLIQSWIAEGDADALAAVDEAPDRADSGSAQR